MYPSRYLPASSLKKVSPAVFPAKGETGYSYRESEPAVKGEEMETGEIDRKLGYIHGLEHTTEELPKIISASFLSGYCDGVREASKRSGIPISRLESMRHCLRRPGTPS